MKFKPVFCLLLICCMLAIAGCPKQSTQNPETVAQESLALYQKIDSKVVEDFMNDRLPLEQYQKIRDALCGYQGLQREALLTYASNKSADALINKLTFYMDDLVTTVDATYKEVQP